MVVMDGTMDHHQYTATLWDYLEPWATPVFGRNFMFIQNSTSPHTALLFLNSRMPDDWLDCSKSCSDNQRMCAEWQCNARDCVTRLHDGEALSEIR